MTTHTAIIGGRDSLIHYGGFWAQTGAPVEFENSITVSVDAGFTATFSFIGTSVTMYGTIAARTLEMQPIWSFVVDGSVTKTYTPPASMAADDLDVAALVHRERLARVGDYTVPSGIGICENNLPGLQCYSAQMKTLGTPPNPSSSVGDFLTYTFDGTSIAFYGGATFETANATLGIFRPGPTPWSPPPRMTNRLSYPGSTPTAVPKPKHKSTPAGVIVGPIIGVLVFFFWRCRRREHESPDRPAHFNKVQMSTANVFDAEHTFAHAGHNVPPIAGPPPLSHGYSSHSQVGLFPTPNSYNDPSSTLATAGVSCTDPDSPLAPPSRHRSPTTTMPSTRYPSTSTSNQGHGTPQTSTSPPNSTASEPLTPQRRNHRLLQEAERAHQLHVLSRSQSISGSVSVSGVTELPPGYSE
ncbi:hypothetical protein B0H14DRAFT_3694139 [Mycena olivaceomarginata]|nr:hypothetical protein B0H14DRAFT_3694139 [Mycena olivaceomarginata]